MEVNFNLANACPLTNTYINFNQAYYGAKS